MEDVFFPFCLWSLLIYFFILQGCLLPQVSWHYSPRHVSLSLSGVKKRAALTGPSYISIACVAHPK